MGQFRVENPQALIQPAQFVVLNQQRPQNCVQSTYFKENLRIDPNKLHFFPPEQLCHKQMFV